MSMKRKRVRSISSKSFTFGYDFVFSGEEKKNSAPNMKLLSLDEQYGQDKLWADDD